VLLGVIGFMLGGLVFSSIFLFRRKQRQIQIELERSTAARIIEEAQKEASAIRREGEIQAKDSILKSRVEFEKEVRETRREVQELERKLDHPV